MPFKSMLSALLAAVPGGEGAIIVDWEGEAVDHVARMDDYELKVLGAHHGVLLDHLRRAIARLGEDDLVESVVTTECTQTIIMPINREYALILVFRRGDVLGRALLEARRCTGLLRNEID